MSKRPSEDLVGHDVGDSPKPVARDANESKVGDGREHARKRHKREVWCGCPCERPEQMLTLVLDARGAVEYRFRCPCTWCGPPGQGAGTTLRLNAVGVWEREPRRTGGRRCNVRMRFPFLLCEDCNRGSHGTLVFHRSHFGPGRV